MNYYISDMHLFHTNVTGGGKNFDGRPFATLDEMHEEMMRRWNSVITNKDNVYILGDMCWKENSEAIAIVSQLKGIKTMVAGNHDSLKDYRYRQLFAEVCAYKEVSDNVKGINHQVVLSHYPIFSWRNMQRGWIHLYGHCHNSGDHEMYQEAIQRLDDYYTARDGEQHKPFFAINIGAMMPYMDYRPRTLAELLAANGNMIKQAAHTRDFSCE